VAAPVVSRNARNSLWTRVISLRLPDKILGGIGFRLELFSATFLQRFPRKAFRLKLWLLVVG
jgi:hypothetical protein